MRSAVTIKGLTKDLYPIQLVQWVDSQCGYGWKEMDEINDELYTMTTIGFLIKETKDAIIMSPTTDNTKSQVNGYMVIPCYAILKIIKL